MALKFVKALVVDDSRLARIALSKLLMKREIDVDMAGNGTEAIEYMQGNRPDVVFMDYMMPDMDGFSASQKILGDPNCAGVPIIMYTSQDSDEDRAKAKEIGISGFLSKPSSEDKLNELLDGFESGEIAVATAPASAEVTEEFEPEELVASEAGVEQTTEAAEPEAPVEPPKPPAEPAPEAEAEPAPAAAALSLEDIRRTARETAERVLADTAQHAVQEKVRAFRGELEQLVESRVSELEQKLDAVGRDTTEAIAREVATDVVQESTITIAQGVVDKAMAEFTLESIDHGAMPGAGPSEEDVRAWAAEAAKEAAQQAADGARQAAIQAAIEAARREIADKLPAQSDTPDIDMDAVRGEIESQLAELLTGADFRDKVRGTVMEHALPSLQQSTEQQVKTVATDVAINVVESTISEKMGSFNEQARKIVGPMIEHRLESVNRRITMVLLVAIILSGLAGTAGVLLAYLGIV